MHRLSTASINLVIIVYLLHLLTRIEARRRVETTRLPPKSHAFSLPSPGVFTNYLHRLPTASTKLVITVYLLHLLTRIEARKHVETARLPPKTHVFSPPFPTAFTNHLHRLPTVLIRLLITVYLLHLLTRIEARRHVEIARLPPKSHVFSPPSPAAFANQPTASADGDRGEEDTSKRRVYHLNRMPFLPHPRLPLQTTCTAYLLPLSSQ